MTSSRQTRANRTHVAAWRRKYSALSTREALLVPTQNAGPAVRFLIRWPLAHFPCSCHASCNCIRGRQQWRSIATALRTLHLAAVVPFNGGGDRAAVLPVPRA